MIPQAIKRPLGVTIISSLLYSACALLTAVVVLTFLLPSTSSNPTIILFRRIVPGPHTPDGAALIFFLPWYIALGVPLASGLWCLKSWARWALLLYTGIPLGDVIIEFAQVILLHPHSLKTFAPQFGLADGAVMLVNMAVVYYLIQPEIETSFSQEDWQLHTEEPPEAISSTLRWPED